MFNFDITKMSEMINPYVVNSKNWTMGKYTRQKDILTFFTYYPMFTNIALDRFKWIFPSEFEQLDSKLIERLEFYRGRCALVKDSSTGFAICDFVIRDKQIYNGLFEPVEIDCVDIVTGKSLGSYSNKGDVKEFIIIPNNELWTPTNVGVMGYVDELVNVNRAIDNNNNQQKFPVVFQGTKEQKEDFKALFREINDDYPYLFTTKQINLDGIQKLDINAPYMSKELCDYRDREISSCLTYLGVNNTNIIKQSGIAPEEVEGNNELIELMLDTYVNPRMRALESIKDTFPELASARLLVNSDNDFRLEEV